MSLSQHIKVNTHYTRSINIERDFESLELVKSYIPTSRAIRTLGLVSERFNSNDQPRAWSLVGPYGSGKSAFAIYCSQCLADPSSEIAKTALKKLHKVEPAIARRFKAATKDSDGGFLEVLVTGSPEPLGRRIAISISEAAEEFWGSRKGRNPKIIQEFEELAKASTCDISSLLALIADLQQQLGKAGSKGLLLIIDELGKFLEYEARHYGANDIFLLQALAEHAVKGTTANLYLFALLHQSFEQYAKGLGENLRNEWSKVQGRFEEIPFLESAEQILRVVSAAFESNFTTEQIKTVEENAASVTAVLTKHKALPGVLDHAEATELFSSCYPLHPVSALILPHLCQKIAQNERTLFSYLGSHEEYGFQDVLEKMGVVGETIQPYQIFDYFISNQAAVMGDYSIHRRWAEVASAVERLGDANKDAVQLLKTIGLFNIVGAKGGFKPNKDILATCFGTRAAFNKALKILQEKSLVTYRKFSGEYRIWQGSDFDLEEALQLELNNLGKFSLADELNRTTPLMPVVARRYTIESGALRYFEPVFVDAQNFSKKSDSTETSRIVFFLSAGQDDEALFYDHVVNHFSSQDLLVLCASGSYLYEAVAESEALKKVQSSRHELASDPVAKREFEDRLTAAEQSELALIRDLIESPQNSQWYNSGSQISVRSKRELQEAMSEVLRNVFSKSPVLHNELINRDKPSAQAVAARNKLLAAMLSDEKHYDLGIDKFPPEKAIYRSLLAKTRLHRSDEENNWKFVAPTKNNATNIKPVWDRIEQFLESTESGAKSFAELNQELIAAPYGVKAGVLPIFYIAVYIVYQHELAIYEQRQYRPVLTEDMIERFVKRPDQFEIQRFRIEGLKASIFKQYSRVIHNDSKVRTLLELARPLAGFMGGLPEYTKKTRRALSPEAQKVRSAFNLAKSPEKLLFEELPKALGFNELANSAKEDELSEFSDRLICALKELKNCYPDLIADQKQSLAEALSIDAKSSLAELRGEARYLSKGLSAFSIDTQGVRLFLNHLEEQGSKDEVWFDNILMFLGRKPAKKWMDSDADVAQKKLGDLARQIVDLSKLKIYERDSNLKNEDEVEIYLLKSLNKNTGAKERIVTVSKSVKKSIESTKLLLLEHLENAGDNSAKLALLAELVDDHLSSVSGEQSPEDSQTELESIEN